MDKKKFVTFGEIMLRLAPQGHLRLSQAEQFCLNYTGAEANIAISLAYMGISTEMITKLPPHDIGYCVQRTLQKFGVDTSHLAWGGSRLGLYYLEHGASQRPSKVIYDRKHSAIAEAVPTDFDWETIFVDAAWFHFTGVTVALSPLMPEICLQACLAAKRLGVTVSCDPNYRSALWSVDEARTAMQPLMKYVDVLITNEEHCDKVLGVRVEGISRNSFGHMDNGSYMTLAQKLLVPYNFDHIAFTLRETVSASVNNLSALLFSQGTLYHSKKYSMQMIDRVGGGDSFAAGLIYGYLSGFAPQQALEFATAASCLKHSIPFDFNLSTPEEVLSLANSSSAGHIVR